MIGVKPKKRGIESLSGEQYEACELLLNMLADLGLFVVQKGELESWDRRFGSKEGGWINKALRKMENEPDYFIEPLKFVERISNHLQKQ